MKKIIFTLLLAIASIVWTKSNAICMVAGTHENGQTDSISGVLIQTGMPCGDEEPCANCLTLALSANEDLYYLSTTDPVVERQLDSIMSELVSVYCICEQPVTVTGVVYTRGSYNYIAISSLSVLGDIQWELRIYSLCDEWNVLGSRIYGPDKLFYETYHYRLTTDTIIHSMRYKKLKKDGTYVGAMREDNNAEIYYYPYDADHEYLLYAFQAKEGDTLSNLWFGGRASDFPNGCKAKITAIKNSTPRIFILEVETGNSHTREYSWIEGVGLPSNPSGDWCPFDCVGDYGEVVLCAYKNGEQVYVSEWGEKYGCEKSSEPYDTIPLYIKDNPGSSTVDPVDPNQIYAVLKGDMLIIQDFTGAEIFFKLTNHGSSNSPARVRRSQSRSFTDSTSVELTENGLYDLELTSEAWDYVIVGTFDFKVPQSVENTPSNTPVATKILRDGQLLFLYKDRMYNVQGQRMQ